AGGRGNEGLGPDDVVRARSGVENKLLAEPLRQPLAHQMGRDVGRSGRSEWRDQTHRPRRIGLRRSNARNGRQRGRARCQMQKISAGEVYRALPRTTGYANGLLRFDAGLLDDRPPFLDLGLLIGTKCLRRLPLALRNFKALLDEALTYSRIAQRAHGRGIELADDVLRRAPGRK